MAQIYAPKIANYDSSIDAFKGLLMLLIVLGHNPSFSHSYLDVFAIFYKFHVASFLLLPFLFPIRRTTLSEVRDLSIRYLVPHFIFFFLACAVYFVVYVPKDLASILQWLDKVATAFIFSAQGYFKQACGFHLFWFLPALLVLSIFRIIFICSGNKVRFYLFGIAMLDHLFIGIYPDEITQYFPFSISLVLYLFPIGLLIGKISGYSRSKWFVAINIIIFTISIFLDKALKLKFAFAGGGLIYPVFDFGHFFLQDLYLISGFFSILALTRKFRLPLLIMIGRRTMIIFLLHSFVQQATIQSGFSEWVFASTNQSDLTIAILFMIILSICYLSGDLLLYFPRLANFILPRDLKSWRLSFYTNAS